MKTHYNVVGAAIVKDGKILALRRADGIEEVINKFEFVGGKVEENETPEQALKRECMEELSLEIEVGELLNTIDYDYSEYSVTLSVYFVKTLSDYVLKQHSEERWIDCAKLDASEWAAADKAFVNLLKNGYSKTHVAKTEEDFAAINAIAAEVMAEAFGKNAESGQVEHIREKYLSSEALKDSISKGYCYKLIYLNGEAVGYFSYGHAKNYNPEYTSGTYLSGLYIKKSARGKRITSKILSSLARPVYLSVKRDNEKAVNIYKHYGFRILQTISVGIDGYILDMFVMCLEK